MNTQQPPTGDVWQRLREQMEAMDSRRRDELAGKGLAERLAERAKLMRQRMERPGGDGDRLTFLAFNKKQERYGIPLAEVAAVESLEHFTPVPNTPGFIRGVTPWRGSILSLIDLGQFFGREETGIADLRACIIVETLGARLAVVAFDVEEIFNVPVSELAPPPELTSGMSPEWTIGVHDENRLILRMSEVTKGIANLAPGRR